VLDFFFQLILHFFILDWCDRAALRYPGEKLTEECVVSAGATYARGELPLVQRVLVLADPVRGRLERIGFVQRSVLHPFATFALLYHRFMHFCASRGPSILSSVRFCLKFEFLLTRLFAISALTDVVDALGARSSVAGSGGLREFGAAGGAARVLRIARPHVRLHDADAAKGTRLWPLPRLVAPISTQFQVRYISFLAWKRAFSSDSTLNFIL
jgi:hypothetical protein